MTLLRQLGLFLAAIGVISALAIAASLTPPKTETAQLLILTILLLSLLSAGVLAYQTWSVERSPAAKRSSKKLPTTLGALSSAAILAVYAAGYHRTASSSNDTFSEHSTVRGAALAIATNVAAVAAPPASGVPSAPAVLPRPSSAESSHKPHPRDSAERSAPNAEAEPLFGQTQPAPVQPSLTAPGDASSIKTPSADLPAPQIAAPAGYQGVPISAPAPPITQPKDQYKDGTYTGWGTCRHGDIQASVTIHDGKIVASAITQCLTRYSCSWIANLPGQVVARQSPNVDYVSGASQSTDAFYYAIVDALAKAR